MKSQQREDVKSQGAREYQETLGREERPREKKRKEAGYTTVPRRARCIFEDFA